MYSMTLMYPGLWPSWPEWDSMEVPGFMGSQSSGHQGRVVPPGWELLVHSACSEVTSCTRAVRGPMHVQPPPPRGWVRGELGSPSSVSDPHVTTVKLRPGEAGVGPGREVGRIQRREGSSLLGQGSRGYFGNESP